MNTIQIHTATFNTASTWNELPEKALMLIASQWQGWKHMLQSKQQGIDRARNKAFLRARILLLQVLMGVNPTDRKAATTKLFNAIPPDQMYDLLKTTDFIFEDNTLTVNKLPKIGPYYGPPNELRQITIGEFASLEANFLNYHKTGKTIYLNNICAILYRPGNEENLVNGDARDKFNDKQIDHRAKYFSQTPDHTKQAVLLFYIGCRNRIVKKHPTVFSGKGKGKQQNWASIIIELAGPKFGTIDQTYDCALGTVLIYLKDLQNKPTKK